MFRHNLFKLTCSVVLALGLLGCEEEDAGSVGFNPFFRLSLDELAEGVYTRTQLESDWSRPRWSAGVREGRVTVVGVGNAFAGKALRVSFPKGGTGLGRGGASWPYSFGTRDDVVCSYRFYLRPGFDFVRGGKLPGLAGGAANDGGNRPNGFDGWSVRLMWRENGRMSAYVYHMDQPTRYGEDFFWSASITAGTWHQVVIRVRMNTPGARDGMIRCWLDGRNVLSVDTIRFRNTAVFGIDQFFFSTFFGGDDASWAPTRDEFITFDDFQVGTP